MLIFTFVYKGNKKEKKEEKLTIFGVVFVAFILALAPTIVIALAIFVLISSTSAINMLFSLHINMKQLITFVISFTIYLFSIDNIVEMIVKHIVGKNKLYFATLLLIRVLVGYVIGLILGLNQFNSLVIAAGITIIVLLIEVFYELNEKKKVKDSKD